MLRSTVIDLNPAEFKYNLFLLSLDKCNGSYNVAYDLSAII